MKFAMASHRQIVMEYLQLQTQTLVVLTFRNSNQYIRCYFRRNKVHRQENKQFTEGKKLNFKLVLSHFFRLVLFIYLFKSNLFYKDNCFSYFF